MMNWLYRTRTISNRIITIHCSQALRVRAAQMTYLRYQFYETHFTLDYDAKNIIPTPRHRCRLRLGVYNIDWRGGVWSERPPRRVDLGNHFAHPFSCKDGQVFRVLLFRFTRRDDIISEPHFHNVIRTALSLFFHFYTRCDETIVKVGMVRIKFRRHHRRLTSNRFEIEWTQLISPNGDIK